jgi:uncharacterized delta-60 repeat protein
MGGIARIAFPNTNAFPSSIAIARGGRLVVAGRMCQSRRDCDLVLARLDRNGQLDGSFGDRGEVVAPVGPGGDCAFYQPNSPMALDSRGRIVMGAFCRRYAVTLARFRPTGHADQSFGNNGEVTRNARRGARLFGVNALAIDSHDRIDVAGKLMGSLGYGVVRFRRNGELDPSFGPHGTARAKFTEKHLDRVIPASAAIDSRDRIVVAGEAWGFSFARFKPNGHLDRSFGQNGRVVTGRAVVSGGPGGQGLRNATSAAIDRRDRIVGAGLQYRRGEHHFAVLRLIG